MLTFSVPPTLTARLPVLPKSGEPFKVVEIIKIRTRFQSFFTDVYRRIPLS